MLNPDLHTVGIVRGGSLNPYEGQYFKELPKYGFQPIGITTPNNPYSESEIPYPVRVGHDYGSLTKGKLVKLQAIAEKFTGYNFRSNNFRYVRFGKLTKDLDIIHTADIQYPYSYQAAKTGKPTVATEWENIPSNFEKRPYSQIKKYNREHINHFIAITEKAKQALITEGTDPDKITVIPAGLDCDVFKPSEWNNQLAQQFNVSTTAVKILFVGRFVQEKGIFDLLNAFAVLQKKQPNVELLIVGSGTPQMTAEIKQQISELQIGAKIRFIGGIKYSEMPKIHNLADIFCLPSTETKTWAEQFGYSLVEGMACEKPVVSTTTGSIPEVVNHRTAGILVKPNNPTELESALEELVSDPKLREKYGKQARQWVIEKFEAKKVACQIAEVYKKILSHNQ